MDLVSRFLESRSESPSQACCRMCCGICMLWILLVSRNPKPLQDGRYKKTTARVVLQQNLWPGTPQYTSIKSGVLARLPLQLYTKLYTKIFACPPKITFPSSRFPLSGIEFLLCILSTLKKCWCIGAFSRNHLNIKENIAFFSWCATGFFVVHLVHFVRKKPANA